MVKQGDVVIVDGVRASVETSWGQGAHRAFKLSDGRVILDLSDSAVVKTVEVPKEEPKPGRRWDWLPKDGQHDLEE